MGDNDEESTVEDDVIDQFYTRYEDDAETSKGSDIITQPQLNRRNFEV